MLTPTPRAIDELKTGGRRPETGNAHRLGIALPVSSLRCPVSLRAYTILEICLVLFIIALIVGASIPFTGGLIAEQQLREPSRQIELLARTARHLATLQQRPYVLILNADHIILQPYNVADPLALFQIESTTATDNASNSPLVSTNKATITTTFSTANLSSTNNAVSSFDDAPIYTMLDPVTQEYEIPESVVFTVRGWQEKEWSSPENRAWIFPPTGLCEPLEVHIQKAKSEAYIEHTYDPLTGSVKSERFYLP